MSREFDDLEDQPTSEPANGDRFGASALATVGLALVALAILIWFLYPRFAGGGPPVAVEVTPTGLARLVTATLQPITATPERRVETTPAAPAPTTAVIQPTPSPVTKVSPTIPIKVSPGAYVKVTGTSGLDLRFRSGPGLDYVTWRIVPEGEILRVTGGPREADGLIWWRVVDSTGLVGWAVEQYLVPTIPPQWTPLPERTPELSVETPTP